MSNEEDQAYQWWNSHVNEKALISKSNCSLNISPPECIMPQKAYIAWSEICPFFQYLNIDQTNIQKYWEFIQKIVSFFCPDQPIPNPISHFPEFIVKLYSIREILLPRSVPMCLNFINAFVSRNNIPEQKINIQKSSNKNINKGKSKNSEIINSSQIICKIHNNETFFCQTPAAFCLYNLPLYFIDPILYFQTLITLRASKHSLWNYVLSSTKVVDAFFEMHTNFISPLPAYSSMEYWEHKLYLSDTLFQLIEHIFVGNNSSSILKNHPKAFQFTIKFVECSIKLTKTAPYSVSIIFFRNITRIFKIIQNKMPTEQLRPLCLQFLLALDKSNSSLTPLAIRFLMKMKPQVILFSRIIRMISKRGIRDLSDIEILSSFCEGSNVLPILILLCRFSLLSKLWHRACINEVLGIISKYPDRNDVKDWFQLFVRRLFIFISISSTKFRYKTRTLLLVESLSSMTSIRLSWLQQVILISAASIWSTKLVPPYFRNFFPTTASQDDVIVHELELFANSDIDLKYFPFDPLKGTLVLPPLVDSHKSSSKSSLAQRTVKRPIHSNSNNTNHSHNGLGSSSVSFSAGSKKSTSKSDKFSGRCETSKVGLRAAAQKKRPEPLIKRPSGTKQAARPLASAICISPIHRR